MIGATIPKSFSYATTQIATVEIAKGRVVESMTKANNHITNFLPSSPRKNHIAHQLLPQKVRFFLLLELDV